MNTLAIATHLNILESAIVRIEEWASVLFVVAKGVGARFVSKKINAEKKMATYTFAGKVRVGEYIENEKLGKGLLYPVTKVLSVKKIVDDGNDYWVSEVILGSDPYKSREFYKLELSWLVMKLSEAVQPSDLVYDRHPSGNAKALHLESDDFYRVDGDTLILWHSGYWQYSEHPATKEILEILRQIEETKENYKNA